MYKNGAYIVMGAQAGDECKGKISAYLTARENAKYIARAGAGPNAEHGIFLKDEKTYIKTNQLPLGWLYNPDVQIRVGSGVAVDPMKFLGEASIYNLKDRVKLDRLCPIVTEAHILGEEANANMQKIGSTMSGTGLCRADFVLRKAKQARDIPLLKEYITDVGLELNRSAKEGVIIVEVSQGFWLGLANSEDYPNVTSSNITPMAGADSVLLRWDNIRGVILVVKAIPSREGAGGFGNIEEMSFEEIKEKGLHEPSSIKGKPRRKAKGIDFDLLKYTQEIVGATEIALTYLDHYDPQMKNVRKLNEVTDKAWELIQNVEEVTGVPVRILETGKAYDNIIDMNYPPLDWESIDKRLSKLG